MAGLTSKTIASTYDSLLKTLADGGITTSLQVIEDGVGDDTCLQLSTKQFLVKSATDIDGTFDVQNSSGHQLLTIDTVSSPEEVVINEGGLGTIDFRVEGSGAANALFVDGTNGNVGIGTSSPDAENSGTKLHIHDGDNTNPARLNFSGGSGDDGSAVGAIQFSHPDNTDESLVKIVAQVDGGNDPPGGDLSFYTQVDSRIMTFAMIIDSAQKVGIGITSPTAKLHVDQSSASGAMPVLKLDQGDVDDSFIDFVGTTASDQTKSLSTDTSVGALTGHIKIEINGSAFWLAYYAAN